MAKIHVLLQESPLIWGRMHIIQRTKFGRLVPQPSPLPICPQLVLGSLRPATLQAPWFWTDIPIQMFSLAVPIKRKTDFEIRSKKSNFPSKKTLGKLLRNSSSMGNTLWCGRVGRHKSYWETEDAIKVVGWFLVKIYFCDKVDICFYTNLTQPG